MSESKVLVLGAGGNIGRNFCRLLDETPGYLAVRVYGPRHRPNRQPAHILDVADFHALHSLIRSEAPDIIALFAGLSGEDCLLDVERTRAVNVGSISVIVEAAESVGVRQILFPSSSAVYGTQYSQPVDEAGELVIQSLFAETKVQAEIILRDASNQVGSLKTSILRIFNVYGNGFSTSLVERLRESNTQKHVRLTGLDEFIRDYVHVDDVVRSALLAVTMPMADDTLTLNIGSGVPTSNRALVEKLSANQRLYYDAVPSAPSYSCANITAAQTLLEFRPTIFL